MIRMLRCPRCAGSGVGRVGAERYYCWDCCIEFTVDKGEVRLYQLDEEGAAVELASVREGEGR